MPSAFPSPNPLDTDLKEWVVLPNRGQGYGHGRTDEGFLTRTGYLLPDGYDRTINMTCRDGKSIAPSFATAHRTSDYLGTGDTTTTGPKFVVAWTTSAGVPFTLFNLGGTMRKYQDDAVTDETDATSNIYSCPAFYDDGAGTAYLYSGTYTFGTGAVTFLNRRTQAGTWTEDGDVNAKFIVAAANSLWRTTSDYQASKCPAGSDPFTIGSWSGNYQVGTNDAKILAMGAIGPAPIIFKEDGIYEWVEADSRFKNVYRVPLNAKNFPFAAPDGAGGLYTTAGNGQLIDLSQFGALVVDDLLNLHVIGRDTPRGQIKALTVDGPVVWASMETAYRLLKSSSISVLKTTNNFVGFTSYTTEATDRKSTTTIDISSLDTLANGDALLIGFDTPFLAVEFIMNTTNSTGATGLSVSTSTGAGTWSSAQPIHNGPVLTSTAPSAFSFSQSGVVSLKISADLSTWVTAEYNSVTKYWWRLTVAAALDATTTISEISIVPLRAAPNFGFTNNNNATAWEASGMLRKILRLDRSGGELIVDDVWTLASVGDVGSVTLATVPTPNAPYNSLFVVDRDEANLLPLPYGQDPAVTSFPVLARDTSGQVPPVFYPSAIDTGGLFELAYIEVYGKNLTEGTDYIQAAYRWDDTNAWFVTDKRYENYCRFNEFDEMNFGKVLHLAFTLIDGAATDPIGPSIDGIVVWLRPLDKVKALQPARTTPEVS